MRTSSVACRLCELFLKTHVLTHEWPPAGGSFTETAEEGTYLLINAEGIGGDEPYMYRDLYLRPVNLTSY